MSTIHKRGRLRGDKILYKDGVNYCVWYPLPGENGEMEDCGMCFDIAGDDISDLIGLLMDLSVADPDIYEEKGETT